MHPIPIGLADLPLQLPEVEVGDLTPNTSHESRESIAGLASRH